MEPLVICAELSSPVAGEVPHLDSLLLFQACNAAGVSPITSADQVPSWSALPPIPLARRKIGDVEVSLCSTPTVGLAHHANMVQRFAKRIDPVACAMYLDAQYQGQINTTGTWTKSYYLPLRLRPATHAIWWCVGERIEMQRLLEGVPAIGKKIAQGHGRVTRWVVQVVETDFSWYCEGKLMRPLPWGPWLPESLGGYRRYFGSCTPPYWHAQNFREIVVPC